MFDSTEPPPKKNNKLCFYNSLFTSVEFSLMMKLKAKRRAHTQKKLEKDFNLKTDVIFVIIF